MPLFLRDDLPLDLRADVPLLADRVLFDRDERLLAERAVGRFADDALRAPLFDADRDEPRAVGRFDPERLRAPPFLLPPRRALDPERFPRDDLALVAMISVLD